MSDTIRYASYGYGGIFDLDKVREEEFTGFVPRPVPEGRGGKLQGKAAEITRLFPPMI